MPPKAPKSSLNSFQEVIDNIHRRETAKQREATKQHVQASLGSAERRALKKPQEEKKPGTSPNALEHSVYLTTAVEFDDDTIQVCVHLAINVAC